MEALACAERAAATLARDARIQLVYVLGSAVAPARPHARDIDLVSLNDASIVLAHEVADSGRCLFARTPEIEVEFVTRARARYWDFKPYRDEQWRLAGERLAERQRGS